MFSGIFTTSSFLVFDFWLLLSEEELPSFCDSGAAVVVTGAVFMLTFVVVTDFSSNFSCSTFLRVPFIFTSPILNPKRLVKPALTFLNLSLPGIVSVK